MTYPTPLGEAITGHYDKVQQQRDAEAAAAIWTDDPELEAWGQRLDQLREDNPAEYQNPGLSQVRERVATYRRRKDQHARRKDA